MENETTQKPWTSGPWHTLSKLGCRGKALRFAVSTDNAAPDQAVICEMNTDSVKVDDNKREANAILISSAPDMADELVRAWRGLDRIMDEDDTSIDSAAYSIAQARKDTIAAILHQINYPGF